MIQKSTVLQKRDVLAGQILFYFNHHERSIRLCSLYQLSDDTRGFAFAVEYCSKPDSTDRNWVLFGEREMLTRQDVPNSDLGCFSQGDLWSFDLAGHNIHTLDDAVAVYLAKVSCKQSQDFVMLDLPIPLIEEGVV